jgi:hypothetical protein
MEDTKVASNYEFMSFNRVQFTRKVRLMRSKNDHPL